MTLAVLLTIFIGFFFAMAGPLGQGNLVNHVALFHNTFGLILWVGVTVLVSVFIAQNVKDGDKTDLNLVDPNELFLFVKPFLFGCHAVDSFNLVYPFVEGNLNKHKLLVDLFEHLQGFLVFLVALPLLHGQLTLRCVLVNVYAWTVLKIFNALNTVLHRKNNGFELLDWLHQKLYLFVYPVVSMTQILLLQNSAPLLKDIPHLRAFPVKMPNAYNFEVDLYVVFFAVTFLLIPCVVFVYVDKLQSSKLKQN